MRIIAGEFRGQKLLGPDGDTTRPVTDRAKQSIFDVLSDRPDDAVVFDCFAGTGSFGLECLSRGARSAIFFESDQRKVEGFSASGVAWVTPRGAAESEHAGFIIALRAFVMEVGLASWSRSMIRVAMFVTG